ncbi:ribonucleoside-diphosphate reductase subunit alpha [Stenotrophomonas phage BUCTxx99]|nr:ribonucleoside-diphosphate reductase subunit alpha [Stenotrophomonas phage BUCTxx99]
MTEKDYTRPRAREMREGIHIDYSRDSLLTDFGKATLDRSYLMPGESYQDAFARVAGYFGDDAAHAQRLYDSISRHHFMPATPVLSNGGTTRGMPISCFLNDVEDSIEGIVDTWNENVALARHGGGIGTYWGDVRSMGETVGGNGKTTGVVPFMKVQDSMTLAISQGSLRRGSAAMYMPIWHPEIEEFIEIRKPTGGDPNRKALNLHHGVVVNNEFMEAVEKGCDFGLRSPKTGMVLHTVSARDLWAKLLQARMEQGEPYILFIDNVNDAIPAHHRQLGLFVKQSNLCVEITLPTGIDHHGKDRTAVCCLSSLNLERWDEYSANIGQVVEDALRMLDNVLEDFILNAPPEFAKAVYSAMRERSVGLGVMGFHSYLQSKGVAFESQEAKRINVEIHAAIAAAVDAANEKLALEKGPCQDAAEAGVLKRFSNATSHAPTASISIIAGTTSPMTEPVLTNAFLQKTLSGSFIVKNRYLEALLESKGRNDKATWAEIIANGGSVQDLNILDASEKAVFRTAFEIDQRWVVQHAADRQPFIDQSQSLNLFLRPNIHKRDLHNLHMMAWSAGVKSLYYARSQAIKRAEAVNVKVANYEDKAAAVAKVEEDDQSKYEVCAACQ